MSIATMTDRTQSLAKRVEAAWSLDPLTDGARAALGPLLRDIAACERLAKAADNVSAAGDSEGASLSVEYHRALDAYREAVANG